MKISIANIGIIRQAEFMPSALTIICGDNNSGKTYATYAWYGFLDFFYQRYLLKLPSTLIGDFINSGSVSYNVNLSLSELNDIISDACINYLEYLPNVFAAPQDFFKDASFIVTLEERDVDVVESYSSRLQNTTGEVVQIIKKGVSDELHFSWIGTDKNAGASESFKSLVAFIFSDTIKRLLFKNTFPRPFVTSTERTGAAVFKNDIVTYLLQRETDKNVVSRYPLPVIRNVDFIKTLDMVARNNGPLSTEHPEIMEEFIKISNGEYETGKNTDMVYFIPKGSKKKFSMAQSASSVRALLDLFFFLKYLASPDYLLIIDEPELNLHPSRQILLARLLTMLINLGLKIMITTHSDYILREINNLLVLNSKRDKKVTKEILSKYDISEKSLIDPVLVSLYTARKDLVRLPGSKTRKRVNTLVKTEFNPDYGFENAVFDEILNKVVSLQQDILFANYDE